MRLVEVAKKLGMTGQQLRRELSQVDFGVKQTDREVPDQLAQGILRFLANKHNIEIKEDEIASPSSDEEAQASSAPQTDASNTEGEEASTEDAKKVHVLRKLTLDDVSEEAVQAQQRVIQQQVPRPQQRRSTRSGGAKKPAGSRALKHQEQIKKKVGTIEIPDSITVKEFAEKAGIQVPDIISALMKNGVMATITQSIDFESAAIVAADLGVEVKKQELTASAEELLTGNLEQLLQEDDAGALQERAPVVTVMGHVDHGKTAILDAIRKTDVVSGEAGGITQHIGAYQIERDGKRVTFLDTPGHEAFTAMRARGAQITDIVVLVVAADEGIKPTTVEAIDHAKDAGVPIIVALNKMDKEGADPDRVKGELAQHELQPEDWGGKTPLVPCSAKSGQGIDDLVDHILLLSDIEELKANPDRSGIATVVEAHLDSSLGPVASLVMNTGTLAVGSTFVCGQTYGRVKSMLDDHGRRLQTVGPSAPVRISGLSDVPETGDILQVVQNEQEAKSLLEQVRAAREAQRKRGLGDLITRLSEGKLNMLKIVLKADSQGSLEAIQKSLADVKPHEGVAPKVIHGAVGAVTEGDVMMAAASGGIVVGFHVDSSAHVESIAERHGVQLKMYDVIYALLEEVEALLHGLIEPEEQESVTGHLEVRGVFFQKKSEQVVGGMITDGSMKRLPFRLLRDDELVGTGRITSVRNVDKDVKEVKEGNECGLRIDCAHTVQEGDVIEAFVKEWKKAGSAA